MSKSRRTARAEASPAPRGKNVFWSPDGGLRGGWLLAASLLCYALVAVGLRLALAAGFGRLFSAWGVDASTAHLAPAWARLVYRWHGSLATAIAALVSVAVSLGLRRLWHGKADTAPPPKAFPLRGAEGPSASVRWHGEAATDEVSQLFSTRIFLLSALLGLALSLLALMLALIPDSVRPEWPLTAPRLAPALIPLCAVTLLTTFAEEFFTRRVLYDGVKPRWGVGWAVFASCAAHFLVGSGWAWSAIGALNALLIALLACAAYARFGLGASVGLRFGWNASVALLMGFGGGEAAVYRFYGVSEACLTGGDAGPACGLWATLLLALALLWLERARVKGLAGRIRRR